MRRAAGLLAAWGVAAALLVAAPVGADPGDPGAVARQRAAEAALGRAAALFDGTAPAVDREAATIVLRDLRQSRADLPAAQKAEAAALLARPGSSRRECTSDVCVHWSTGILSPPVTAGYVDAVRSSVQHVHDVYRKAGYREPKADGDSGGDARFDVYLQDLGAQGLYGYCTSDDPSSANDVSAYCVLDNDYDSSQFPTNTPLQNMHVTAAHEYFHAVQFGYDVTEDAWVMEATATWAEDEIYDRVNDNLQYLPAGPMGKPHLSLDTTSGGYWYGAWIFFRRLSERMPASKNGLPTVIRDIWRRLDGAPGAPDDSSLEGIQRVLRNRGSSLGAQFLGMAVANRFPARMYDEGRSYPGAPGERIALTVASPSAADSVSADHLTSQSWRFVPKGLRARDWQLRISVSRTPGRPVRVMVTSLTRSGDLERRVLDLAQRSTIRVPFSVRRVSRVELTVVSSSRSADNTTIEMTAVADRG